MIPKNYRYITGQFSSPKGIGEDGFEAGLEPDFLTLAEFDPCVKAFEVRPCRVYWKDNLRKTHRYTPDCRVIFNDVRRKPWIVEIKFRSFLAAHWSDLRPRYRAAVHSAALEGSRFLIFTGKEIRTQYLECAKFPLQFVRRGANESSTRRIFTQMREMKVTTPQHLMEHLSSDLQERALLLPALWHAIGTFQIKADLHVPLTMNSRIESLE